VFAVPPVIVDAPATTAEVLAFHLDLDVIAVVAVMLAIFHLGIRRLGPRLAPPGEAVVTRSQTIRYHVGVLVVLFVSGWPIGDIGVGSLFMAHMIEHLSLTFVVPPLLITGIPGWLLRTLLKPVLPVLRILAKPMVALFLFNAILAAMMMPSAVNLMLTNELFHLASHTSLFVAAVLMWFPILGPIPELPALAPFYRIGYLFLQSLVPTIPATFLTLGERPLYPIYEQLPRLWGIPVYEDQVISGLIMKIGGGLLLWGFITYYFFAWHAEEFDLSMRGKRNVPAGPRKGDDKESSTRR
jgi:putative membrane protein